MLTHKLLFSLVIGTILGVVTTYYIFTKIIPLPTKTVEVIKQVEVIKNVPTSPKGTIISITIKDLATDLATRYPHISKTNRDLLLLSIAKASDQYHLNPLILYSLIAVESSFRWWITHPQVTVKNSEGKLVKTSAIGLGGVVYEIWGKELIEAHILETKSDLYQITTNVASIGYIYSKLKSMPLHPKAHNQIESGLIRYFGGGYRSYFNKIDSEVASIFRNKLYKD